MTLILIAIIAVIILALIGVLRLDFSFFSYALCPLFATGGFVALLVYCVLIFGYIGAKYKAEIINKEYGTHYTQEEVFYASSVIDAVRELDRKRVELNGDLITGK